MLLPLLTRYSIHVHSLLPHSHTLTEGPSATCAPPPPDYVIAVVQLVSANYMGQHFFLEEMSGMGSPSTFQHSTAWAQVGRGEAAPAWVGRSACAHICMWGGREACLELPTCVPVSDQTACL